MASINEATGLLGTATRVRPVHESALVVHEAVEVPPGAREALAEVVAADLQELRGAAVAYSEDLAEDVGDALRTIET